MALLAGDRLAAGNVVVSPPVVEVAARRRLGAAAAAGRTNRVSSAPVLSDRLVKSRAIRQEAFVASRGMHPVRQ